MKVWVNNELVDKQDAKLSVFDHGTLYGDGVFEGIRIYDGAIFECDAHMERLFQSAAKIRLTIPYTKEQLVDAMYLTLRANGLQNGYIRLVATRGEGTLGLGPDRCPRANVFVIADTIQLYPPSLYEEGMPVIIAKTLRTSPRMVDPSVKSLNYLNNILAKIEGLDAGVAEVIMLNDQGNVAEASGDNVFIVKDGALFTPPPNAGILLGITRGVVLKLAAGLGIHVGEKNFTPVELYAADECFLTGTAAEIIPVTRIDAKVIGSGKSGPISRKLIAAFHEFIRTRQAQPK